MLFQNKKDLYQLCLVAVEAEEAIRRYSYIAIIERKVPFAKGRFSHETKISFQNFELIDHNCACFKF